MATNSDGAARVREATAQAIQSAMQGVRQDIPYVLDDLIGRGSFGAVFRAHKKNMKEIVAVKVLNMDAPDESEVRDAIQEVQLLSQLKQGEQHNIIRYHESFLEGSRLWVVMDYCGGGSIRTLFKAGRLDERYITVITREVLIALAYIHRNGIIHRDVKAANILINMDGRVQLCDFGVSAQLTMGHGKRSTFVGTPWWMAPEVIMEGATYNSKADIWSLGITVIELANMKPPLNELEPMRAIMLIPRQAPPRLEGGNWTNPLREFVALCLNERPDDRPSAEELSRTKAMKNCKLPTSLLKELVVRYDAWKSRGGIRNSVLPQGGGPDNILGGDEHMEEADWDFDTIKSRLSGVPSFHTFESGYMSRESTVKPARTPSPMRLKDGPRGGDTLHPLLQLFSQNGDTYQQSIGRKTSNEDLRVHPQQRSVPSTRTASPESFVQIDMDIFMKDQPTTYSHQSEPGVITIPDFPDTFRLASAPVAAPRSLTPPTATADPPPATAPPSVVTPLIRKITSVDPISSLSEPKTAPSSPPRIYPRASSPIARPTVSAPSSPPRPSNIPQMQLNPNHANNGYKGHHLPSKSAPNMAALREASGSGAPPLPSLTENSKVRSGDSTPLPHMKARSQDISAAQKEREISGPPPQRPQGRAFHNKPSNLNLKLPSNKLTSFDIMQQGMLPPSPSRPFASSSHAPSHSISSQTSTNMNGPPAQTGVQTPSFFFPPLTASIVGESWDLPHLEKPNLDVLSHTASADLLLAELDRILGGICHSLEVMGVGIESLATQRRRDRQQNGSM
ncbi:kinase-like domain-containing protein [Terfezia claveryi]|nr:kinase-like domain-containing protein [Terfezia claveryi]